LEALHPVNVMLAGAGTRLVERRDDPRLTELLFRND